MRRLGLVLGVLFIVPACLESTGGGDGGSGGDAGGAAGGSGGKPFTGPLPDQLKLVFDTPADPVAVSPTLDPGSAVSAEIGYDGGSLSATGPDGTRFDLTIPPTAVVVPTVITMTPVSAIGGMPFGTGPVAVQLEPEGLLLYEFATLTITPTAPLPVDEQILFGWSGSGQDLILAPPVMDSTLPAIRLWHFSGYGATKGFRADPESVRARLGGATESRLQNAMAEFLGKERQKQLLGSEGADFDADTFIGLMQEYIEKVVKPRLEHVEDGCAEAKLAAQTALGAERQLQLLGVEEGLGFDIWGPIEKGGLVCMKEEHELCVQDHVIHRILPAYLGMLRQAQLLGAGENLTPVLQQAGQLVNKCLQFEMQFDSEARFDAGGGDGYDSTVTAKAKMNFDALSFGFMPVSTALINTSFTFRESGCSVTSVRGGGDYMAMDLGWSGDPEAKTVDFIQYVHFPGTTSESYTIKCPDSDPFTAPPQGLWQAVYLVLHEQELDQTAGFKVPSWNIQGNELYATSSWNLSDGSLGLTETGTLKLYHRPAP